MRDELAGVGDVAEKRRRRRFVLVQLRLLRGQLRGIPELLVSHSEELGVSETVGLQQVALSHTL